MTTVLQSAALSSLLQLHPLLLKSEAVPTLIQQDLYFGRNIGTRGRVTEQQFQQFLQDIVVPRFHTGVTVYDAKGQFLDNDKDLIREPTKVISVIYQDNVRNQEKINEIINIYKQKFQQKSVLQVKNQDIAVGFGQGEDLIDNDPTPELIQVDLYFRHTSERTERANERQFRQFLKDVVTPRFPDGLTVYPAKEQLLEQGNSSMLEPSKVVSLILEDTDKNEQSLNQIAAAYEKQFQQKSILEVVNEEVKVGFGQGEDLIDNDPTPELIQVDLYFGRNIGMTGQVTERQFRQFLREDITPRFPDGLTVYDADGQFLNQSNQLIREPSKVVSLLLEDTQINERSINQIIDAYKQKFRQESVLAVVDETLNVSFSPNASTVPTGFTLLNTENTELNSIFQQDKQPCFRLPIAKSTNFIPSYSEEK
jgi:hypothetical protein